MPEEVPRRVAPAASIARAVGPVANAAGCLDFALSLDGSVQQTHILQRCASGAESSRRLHKGRPRVDRESAGENLLFIG